jgi:hypothetical protein
MSITAIALSTLVFAPSSVASPTAQALDFLSADLIDNLQVGDPAVVYENIMSDTNVRARVEVTAIQNMCSELTSRDGALEWRTFQAHTTDAGDG